jgi:hypothetical protein
VTQGSAQSQVPPSALALIESTNVPLTRESALNPPSASTVKVPPSLVISPPLTVRVTSNGHWQAVPLTPAVAPDTEKVPPSSVAVLAALPWNWREREIPPSPRLLLVVAQSHSEADAGVLTNGELVGPPSGVRVTVQVELALVAAKDTMKVPIEPYPEGQEGESEQLASATAPQARSQHGARIRDPEAASGLQPSCLLHHSTDRA